MDPDKSMPVTAPPLGVPVAAAPTVGPKIFQFYPSQDSWRKEIIFIKTTRQYFKWHFAAFLTYASHYDLPLVVHDHDCLVLAVFQVNRPTALIRPFSQISPHIILRGWEIIALTSVAA
jgi:hypothetical protein